jgi:uncharacterized protein (DUF1800 family)
MTDTDHPYHPPRLILHGFRRLVFLCLLVCSGIAATSLAWAFNVGPSISGSWFDPAKDGQGFTVQVIDESTVLATWFTFDQEGNQAWLQGLGAVSGSTVVFESLNRYVGPSFGSAYDPADRQSIPAGRLSLTFHDCHRATAEYEATEPFVDDTLSLARLTQIVGHRCDAEPSADTFPLHAGLSGAWYAPALDGQGWMLEVLDASTALVYWFTYDGEGNQRWYVGVGQVEDRAIRVQRLDVATGGRFGPNYDPSAVERARWGSLTLRLWPCNGAQVTYAEGPAHLAKSKTIGAVTSLVSINGRDSCPPDITKYSAARLLDQTTFGPTPETEALVMQSGPEAWVLDQLSEPASHLDVSDLHCMDNFEPEARKARGINEQYWDAVPIRMFDLFIDAPDQLRLRMSWALSQLLVVSRNASDIQEIGTAVYFNMLQDHAFGNFRDLIRAVTLSPTMGQFLDNAGSFATSEECPQCLPNENYARELLMLFTLGVHQLNMDGTVKTDSSGEPLQTFAQSDVMELARALSGWRIAETDESDPRWDDCEHPFIWYEDEMVPHTGWPRNSHDPGEKQLLGQTIPAGQGIRQDLESVLDILMAHPNMAPFIAYRLIQHFTTSDPSPQYVERVARVFADNGRGVSGDLSAVIKAIMLDSEARAGDVPDNNPPNFGRIRDLVLRSTAIYRAMACEQLPTEAFWVKPDDPNYRVRYLPYLPNNRPFGAPEVFNFYPPNNKVPGMNLVSPEHMLLNFNGLESMLNTLGGDARSLAVCPDYAVFTDALSRDADALLGLMKDRFMRGRDSFSHESIMNTYYSEGLRDWYWNNQNSSNPEAKYYNYQLSMFFGYTLLGEEFGVIR